MSKPAHIPAVEVDPPGCSFNPTHESHQVVFGAVSDVCLVMIYDRVLRILLFNQDTLATAVAEEMIKVYKNELGPEPVPLTVPGEAISEEDVSFTAICNFYNYKK